MRVEISTWGSFKPGDVIVENPQTPGANIVVERTIPGATVGTALSRPGQTSRRVVFRTEGVHANGDTYPWVDEHGNLFKDDELIDFRPDVSPDLTAAVDAYARHVQRIRAAVKVQAMSNGVRADLLDVIDELKP